MPQSALDQPFTAELVEDKVVITAPEGFAGVLTTEAARASAGNLRRAIISADDGGETYQKPLG
ncbi:MAG: hypothetical protein KAG62_16765 [Caulobacter sp.]|nr:hypothetical protein [Caulobacter sp.]